jgi:hypothetical protein
MTLDGYCKEPSLLFLPHYPTVYQVNFPPTKSKKKKKKERKKKEKSNLNSRNTKTPTGTKQSYSRLIFTFIVPAVTLLIDTTYLFINKGIHSKTMDNQT